MARGALPTFLIIGADKAGTTSLHHYLGAHPEVQVSHPKELHYFSGRADPGLFPPAFDIQDHWRATEGGNSSRGIDWYRSHFDARYAVRGESTPNYTAPWYPGTADRIRAAVPDVQLIYCVRDPVARALSSYTFRRTAGTEQRAPEEALLPDSWYAVRSRYATCLDPYLELFGRERILIVEAERLDRDRRATLARVFSFLGVADDFWSDEFERRWNVTARQRGARFGAVARLRRRRTWRRVTARVPRRALWLAERATRRGEEGPSEHVAVPQAFVESLRDDAARFREAVGHDFPGWSV